MKKNVVVATAILSFGLSVCAHAQEHGDAGHDMKHHHQSAVPDDRISLNLSPAMKQHQLANMRAHVAALRAIVGYLAEEDYERAADVAHNDLGATPAMQQMCNMFANEEFRKLGLAFHQSGDALGDTLKTGDMKRSLRALQTTMNYCVNCHATYRQ